jgi:hypothetical protein
MLFNEIFNQLKSSISKVIQLGDVVLISFETISNIDHGPSI